MTETADHSAALASNPLDRAIQLLGRFIPHLADEADCELWIRAYRRREPLTRGRHVRQVLQHPAAVRFLSGREQRDRLCVPGGWIA